MWRDVMKNLTVRPIARAASAADAELFVLERSEYIQMQERIFAVKDSDKPVSVRLDAESSFGGWLAALASRTLSD